MCMWKERRTGDGSGFHGVLRNTSGHCTRTIFDRHRKHLSLAFLSLSLIPLLAFRNSRDPVDPDGHFARLELRTGALQDPDRGVLGGSISWGTHPSEGRSERSLSGAEFNVEVSIDVSLRCTCDSTRLVSTGRKGECGDAGETHGNDDRPASFRFEQGSVHHPPSSPLNRVEDPDGIDVEGSLLRDVKIKIRASIS